MNIENRYGEAVEDAVNALCEEASRRNWIFEKQETGGIISIIFQLPGKTWTEGIWVSADKDGGILEMASRMLEEMPVEKRAEAAFIVNAYNIGRLLGMIEMDIYTGEVWYKIKLSIAGCRGYLIDWQGLMKYISRETRQYRDLLMQLNSGNMTVSQILQQME